MPTNTGQNWGFTSQTYTPAAQQDIFSAMRRAQDVSNLPYQPYLGQTVAGFSPSQIAAMQGIYGIQGYAQPYIDQATGLLQQAQMYADPSRYNQQSLQQYYNPYQQNVIDATMANIAQENLRQQNDLTSRAIQQGGFGGDRTGIARAELNRLQNLQNAQTLSGLQAQGFSQAQQQYNLAQQRAIEAAQSGAYSLGQLGMQGQQAGLQGLQALLGIGGMERELGQAQLEDQFKRFMTMQGYPWETAQWLASIVGSLGPQAGGTTTGSQIGGSSQTSQGPSALSSILGAGTSGFGALLKLIPGFGAAGAKDGGRINKSDGGSFSDLMSLGFEDPWYGFDPELINEGKRRQWMSRDDADQTADQQIKDRSWLNTDETYDPYQNDTVDYEDDNDPVLRNFGGRTGYKGGGGPYEGTVPYVSGDTVGFIDNLKLPSAPSPRIPKADFLKPPSVGEGGGDSLGDIAKSLPQLGVTISRLLSKKDDSALASQESESSPQEETASEEQYGGRVNMADGGNPAPNPPQNFSNLGKGFGDWLSKIRGGAGYASVRTPYVAPTPSNQPRPTAISSLNDLYRMAFKREADPAGLEYWNKMKQEGMSLGDIARQFIASPEAQQSYSSYELGNLGNLIQSGLNPLAEAPKTLYTTGGAPIVNPDGSPVTLQNVEAPSAVLGEEKQGLYSEGDIAAAGQISGPDPGLLMQVGKNPALAFLINSQQQQKQAAADAKVAAMQSHNAGIRGTPRTPAGYFMNLDYSVMSPNGLFGFNPISSYYSPLYPTANAALSPTGGRWSTGGAVKEKRPGFQFGGMPSVEPGHLPNVMTGHGSQTNPSSFQPGYNPYAFSQQRAEGGRTGYRDGGSPEIIDKIARGIAAIESGGRRDPYSVVGPTSRSGDRPYGKYQIMGSNIAKWGREAGYPNLTPREFLANPKIQEDVARHQFANIYAKSGNPSAVAGEWLGGPGWRTNKSADVLGTTVPEYMRRFSRAFGQSPQTAVAAAEPMRTLTTRPLTGERVGAAPRKGFSLADLNPIGSAQAEETPASKETFGEVASRMRSQGMRPDSKMFNTPNEGLLQGFESGLGKDRDMMGDTPYAVKMVGSPFGSWDDGKGFTESATTVAEDETPSAKPKSTTTASENGPFYGDWRDQEPWKSDPIGGFLDELTGDVAKSETRDKSSESDFDLGGLSDLFKGFSHGGRAHYDGGGPADIEDLDPEFFNPEPMTEPKGFESLADEEPASKDVVSEDIAPVAKPSRREPERSASSGMGNLSSLGDAMIAAGFGMMAGRSPNAWQNIGMGGLKGVEAYQSAEAIRNRREADFAKIKQKEREAEQSREYLKDFLTAPTAKDYVEQPAKIEGIDRAGGADKLDTMYNELERYQRAIAMAPDAATASRLRLMQENLKTRIQRVEKGGQDAMRLAEEARRAHKESPEGIIETKTAEDLAKQEIEMGQLGRKSQDTLANLNTMKDLITDPSVHTGPLEESKLRTIRQIGSQYAPELVQKISPFDISKEGVAKTGDLVARANTMVRDALGGSLGAGVSNADVKFLQSAQVSLGNTPEENKRIVDAAIRLTKLNMTLSKEAEAYKESHAGHLDAGWVPYRDKIQENFYGGSQGSGSTGKPSKEQIMEEIRRRQGAR